MGCSSSKSSLTNSIRPKQSDNNMKNNNINIIQSEQKEKNNSNSLSKNQIIEQNENNENLKSSQPNNNVKENNQNLQSSQPLKKERLSAREQVRKNPNFLPIEEMPKIGAYLQFLQINDYLLKHKTINEPYDWFDENLENKLIEDIKKIDHETQIMSDFVEGKAMFDMHPETMPMYIDALQWGDYKWQFLCRLLLLFQTFKNDMDVETMAKAAFFNEELKKEKEKEKEK